MSIVRVKTRVLHDDRYNTIEFMPVLGLKRPNLNVSNDCMSVCRFHTEILNRKCFDNLILIYFPPLTK